MCQVDQKEDNESFVAILRFLRVLFMKNHRWHSTPLQVRGLIRKHINTVLLAWTQTSAYGEMEWMCASMVMLLAVL